jgi:uncharacterized protein DUF87
MAGRRGTSAKKKKITTKRKPTKEEKPWLTEKLVLGWKVTKGLDPEHWENPRAKPGGHSIEDVVTAERKRIAHHTVIIAQSGSGKSFFLGRLIEEILVKTSCNVLIFDPNSDFRKISECKEPKYWTKRKYRYNRAERRGFLADEPTQGHFLFRWKKVTTLLHGRPADRPKKKGSFQELQLDWRSFPIDVLAAETEPELRDQLQHCHSFVITLADLAHDTKKKGWSDRSFFENARQLCENTQQDDKTAKPDHAVLQALGDAFGLEIASGGGTSSNDDADAVVSLDAGLPSVVASFNREAEGPVRDKILDALRSRRLFSKEAWAFYFPRVILLEGSGKMDPRIHQPANKREPKRVEIVDLPSLPARHDQKVAISTFLETAWMRARAEWEVALKRPENRRDKRVPTFIVVEEAHNLIPSKAKSPIDKKLQEQFRRVAAEGRKFGLFLILVSQRPDKLDRMIMSECENRAVMRVGSSFVLRTTCEILGLDGVLPRLTEKVLEFDLGRALLVGPWVGEEPAFLVSAARRTMEGGRDLDPDHWTKPAIDGKP